MVSNKLRELTDTNFDEEVRRSRIPVIIDFWAPWCSPCRIVTPILERMAEKYGSSVKFLSMNVEEHKSKPSEYGVRSIPTLLFFKEGTIKNQMIGTQSEESIEKAIRGLL